MIISINGICNRINCEFIIDSGNATNICYGMNSNRNTEFTCDYNTLKLVYNKNDI